MQSDRMRSLTRSTMSVYPITKGQLDLSNSHPVLELVLMLFQDMPFPELSMVSNPSMRRRPDQHLLDRSVPVILFLGMSKDEADLLNFATAITFAVQTSRGE